MNENKLSRLFAAARNQPAAAAPADFAADVLRAIHRKPPRPAEPGTVWDQLNGLFPRLAWAAALVIVLCVAADLGLTAAGLPGLSEGAAQVTSQYLFNAEDL